jgi:hypothetical protein
MVNLDANSRRGAFAICDIRRAAMRFDANGRGQKPVSRAKNQAITQPLKRQEMRLCEAARRNRVKLMPSKKAGWK